MQNPSKHCIWLIFESALLDSIIHDLSKKYSTPLFQPHCTIIGRTSAPLVQLKGAIAGIISDKEIHDIRIGEIGYRDDYYMSYYLEIQENQYLSSLHKNLITILDIEKETKYLPHISLMYSSIRESEKQNINIPIHKGDVVKTKALQITECNENVENWKPVFELLLK